ncbi:apolipoprotein N-acyltransferase [Verrucomicrobiota bacterium]
MNLKRMINGSFVWRFIAAVMSGGLLASAFPPIESSEAAWVAFIPILLIAKFSNPVSSFRWGFFSGLIFWLTTLSWLFCLSETWGPLAVVILSWIALSSYCALYTGAFAMVVSRALRNGESEIPQSGTSPQPAPPRRGPKSEIVRNLGFLAIVPLLWVGFEYLRSNLFSGFPWNALGISQYRSISIIQVAEWGGVYAVSALLMFMNTALSLTVFRIVDFYKNRRRTRLHVELIIGCLVCILCWQHGKKTVKRLWQENTGRRKVRIAAIQPNIPQYKKWREEIIPEIYCELKKQTELALVSQPQMVVWPETAVPDSVTTDSDSLSLVKELAHEGAPILVGAMEVEWLTIDRFLCYNSSFLFNTDGEIAGCYRKRHLVPFGEYLPLDKKITLLQKLAPLQFTCTPGKRATVFRLEKPGKSTILLRQEATEDKSTILFSVLICFEDIMAYLARDYVRNGARLLINQTNDAWFDGSSAAVQHMSHCVFRCVENRVGAVRCANTGVTCFIDRTGLIDGITRGMLAKKETHLANYRTGDVSIAADNMPLTFYTKFGDLPFALPCGIMSGLIFVFMIVRLKKTSLH